MRPTITNRIRHSLLAVAVVASVAVTGAARPAQGVSASPPPRPRRPVTSQPAAGTDIYHRDTAVAQYIQGENGLIHLRLYDGPVGIPTMGGWRPRDRRLRQPNGAGPLMPTREPFDLRLTPTSVGSTLASLTNEDGVTLGVGLESLNGAAPAVVAGQVGADAVTYTAPVASSPSDVSLRSTESGLDVRIVLHSATEAGSIVLGFTPDPRAHLSQATSGAIEVTRPITRYGDNGQPLVTIQPEYIIAPPIARDSSAGVTASALTAAVTTTLAPDAAGRQDVTLTIDPMWVHAAHRAFPVQVDVPIATAYSAVDSGTFGTVTSCAPTMRAPQTDVIVGMVDGCAYHGDVSFNTSSLHYDTTIVSATLHLYTPRQTGPTSVRIYANTPPSSTVAYQPASWEQPSWSSAPAIAPGAAGIAQSGSTGQHEQSWDVTSLVQQWVRDGRTNGGLTLVGADAPVLFASQLGAGTAAPTQAPSLDITYASQTTPAAPQAAPAASQTPIDNAYYITGVSGTFGFVACASSGLCSHTFSNGQTYYALSVDKVPDTASSASAAGYTGQLSGSYVRLGVTLSCTSTTPGYGWWSSYGLPTSAAPYNLETVYGLMEQAYTDGLIPIVNLLQNDSCPSFLLPSAWASEVKDFINGFYIEASDMPQPLPMTYFEITNEINDDPQYGYGGNNYGNSQYAFQDFFSATAQSLRGALDAYNGNTTSPYRILTGGMLAPTAVGNSYTPPGPSPCMDINGAGQPTGYENVDVANNALTEAENAPYAVPSSRLGVAIHPYDYNTNETQTYWQNYYNDYGYSQQSKNGYAGVCGDLGTMLNLWTNTYFPGLPVIATEDNWSSDPQNHLPSCTGGGCHITCSNAAGCSGTYLVDLLTWLSDHYYDCMTADNSVGCSSASTFRLSWFRGMDVPTPTFSSNPIDPLGIYGVNGPPAALAEKNFTTTYCPNDPNVMGTHSIANAYWELGSCY